MPPDPRIGQLLGGKYRLTELLALGGMGLVYAARHEVTGRALAIKLLRPELVTRPDIVRRVSAEARLAVEASHPNVVEVVDAGSDAAGTPYLVLERLYGRPLEALLAAPLPLLTTVQALVPVMNALGALHHAGIVHRDIKPSNIFLNRDGAGRVTPKLLDFGIAKALADAGCTVSGTAIGTPAYMAPEQVLGSSAEPYADIWSLAVVFARCLTGRFPFEAVGARLGSLRHGLRPEELAGVPEPVALVLIRALELEPLERPASMAEFRAALLDALDEVDSELAWPSAVTSSYGPADTGLAVELAFILDAGSAATDLRAVGVRARARHVFTKTLSRISDAAPPQSRGRRLLWSVPLLAAGISAWLLSGTAPRARAPSLLPEPPLASNDRRDRDDRPTPEMKPEALTSLLHEGSARRRLQVVQRELVDLEPTPAPPRKSLRRRLPAANGTAVPLGAPASPVPQTAKANGMPEPAATSSVQRLDLDVTVGVNRSPIIE